MSRSQQSTHVIRDKISDTLHVKVIVRVKTCASDPIYSKVANA